MRIFLLILCLFLCPDAVTEEARSEPHGDVARGSATMRPLVPAPEPWLPSGANARAVDSVHHTATPARTARLRSTGVSPGQVRAASNALVHNF